jgi:glycosyltransferase involved in cell wall biosynthesis
MRVHIGFCSPHWPPAMASNGIVTYVAAMRDYLLSEGHRVSIIADGRMVDSDGRDHILPAAAEKPGPIGAMMRRVHRHMERNRGDLPAIGRVVAAQVRDAQRIMPMDLVDMEESYGWSDAVQRLSGVPVVTRLHGPYFLKAPIPRTALESQAHSQRCKAEGRAVRRATSLTSPTRATLQATCAHYDRPVNGLSAAIPNPIRTSANPWRLDGCDRDMILMVGRFDHAKGADIMLLAFDRLVARRPSARLTLVGPDWGMTLSAGRKLSFDDYVMAHLSPQARARVRFMGRQPPDVIAQLRRKAFVTVQASRSETYSYTLVESLEAGCPVISTDWSGAEEILEAGRHGLLTPMGDPQALAANLEWMLDHPQEAALMADNGRLHCQEQFCVQAVGSRMVDWYRATLAERRR